jgi:hypothetical protein
MESRTRRWSRTALEWTLRTLEEIVANIGILFSR